MKKGLLSILAGALVVVGCQNYDDQFDSLESQINALASTVAGLSQVQSDLSSLAGTVSSLSSTVASLGSAIDTAVSNGLADITADIAALQAAVADVASSEDVSAIADAVTSAQADLDELLANSSIFTGDVVISTQNTLDVFHAMGSTLAIVNGDVDIDVSTSMDMVMVQEVVNQILNVTGSFEYTAGADVDTEVTFSNLAGTATLTIDQEGGYMLENLTSATVITLDDDTSVDIVHLGSLTTVTSINGGNIHFEKATELHLTSMASYDGNLSLKVAKGGVIDLSAYRDVDTDGDATGDNLTIYGPASFTVSELDGTGSTLSFEEVPTVVVNGYNGTVKTLNGVENFTSDNLVAWTSTSSDLVSVDVTGALNSDEDEEDEDGPAISLSSKGDLETVKISGVISGITLSTNGNLTDVTINATVDGSITIDNNSDLVNITLTDATANGVTIDTNSDLESLTVDHTTTADEDGSVVVTDNESLTTLTVAANNLDTLTITGNSDLETIDLSAVTAVGDSAEPNVTISGNNLVASKVDAEEESIETESGMNTGKAYFEAVVEVADDATANVVFDEVETYIDEDGDDQGTKTSGDAVEVLVLTPKVVTTAGKDAVAHKLAIGIELNANHNFGISIDGEDLLVNTSDTAVASLALNTNETLAIAQIKRAAALTNADAFDLTIDAHEGYSPTGQISLTLNSGGDYENTFSTVTGSAAVLGASDVLKLTINGKSVTTSIKDHSLGRTATAEVASNAHLFASEVLAARWKAVYGTGGTSATASLFDATETTSGVIDIAAKAGSGRRGFDKSYSISVIRNASSTASNTSTPTIAWQYGATSDSSDNKTISNGIIVTIESQIAGLLLDATDGVSITGLGNAKISQLTSTLKLVVETATSTSGSTPNIYPAEARGNGTKGAGGDAILPEAELEEVATAATSTDNTAWLED